MTAPDKDLLSAEERVSLAHAKAHWMRGPHELALIAALDRLAPPPAPPEPRVSELAERMRARAASTAIMVDREREVLNAVAYELDAAMERENERRKQAFHKAFVDLTSEFRPVAGTVMVDGRTVKTHLDRLLEELAP